MTARADAQVLPAEDHVAEISVLAWRPSPELTLSTNALAGSSVSAVDFVQEFGLLDSFLPECRAAIGRNHKFRLSYARIDYQETATIQRALTFQG